MAPKSRAQDPPAMPIPQPVDKSNASNQQRNDGVKNGQNRGGNNHGNNHSNNGHGSNRGQSAKGNKRGRGGSHNTSRTDGNNSYTVPHVFHGNGQHNNQQDIHVVKDTQRGQALPQHADTMYPPLNPNAPSFPISSPHMNIGPISLTNEYVSPQNMYRLLSQGPYAAAMPGMQHNPNLTPYHALPPFAHPSLSQMPNGYANLPPRMPLRASSGASSAYHIPPFNAQMNRVADAYSSSMNQAPHPLVTANTMSLQNAHRVPSGPPRAPVHQGPSMSFIPPTMGVMPAVNATQVLTTTSIVQSKHGDASKPISALPTIASSPTIPFPPFESPNLPQSSYMANGTSNDPAHVPSVAPSTGTKPKAVKAKGRDSKQVNVVDDHADLCKSNSINKQDAKSTNDGKLSEFQPSTKQNKEDQAIDLATLHTPAGRAGIRCTIKNMYETAAATRLSAEVTRSEALRNFDIGRKKERRYETLKFRGLDSVQNCLAQALQAIPLSESPEHAKKAQKVRNALLAEATDHMKYVIELQKREALAKKAIEYSRDYILRSHSECRKASERLAEDMWQVMDKALRGEEGSVQESDKESDKNPAEMGKPKTAVTYLKQLIKVVEEVKADTHRAGLNNVVKPCEQMSASPVDTNQVPEQVRHAQTAHVETDNNRVARPNYMLTRKDSSQSDDNSRRGQSRGRSKAIINGKPSENGQVVQNGHCFDDTNKANKFSMNRPQNSVQADNINVPNGLQNGNRSHSANGPQNANNADGTTASNPEIAKKKKKKTHRKRTHKKTESLKTDSSNSDEAAKQDDVRPQVANVGTVTVTVRNETPQIRAPTTEPSRIVPVTPRVANPVTCKDRLPKPPTAKPSDVVIKADAIPVRAPSAEPPKSSAFKVPVPKPNSPNTQTQTPAPKTEVSPAHASSAEESSKTDTVAKTPVVKPAGVNITPVKLSVPDTWAQRVASGGNGSGNSPSKKA